MRRYCGSRLWPLCVAFGLLLGVSGAQAQTTVKIGLAVPTLLLYEFSIIAVRMVERKRAEAEADAEAGKPA